MAVNTMSAKTAIHRENALKDRIAQRLFILAIILMPFSYGTKFLLGKENLVWIDPTLVLAAIIFILQLPSIRPVTILLFTISSLISALCGFVLYQPDGSGFQALYATLREPLRLALNVVWFAVCVRYFRSSIELFAKWLTISVILQICIAFYLMLGAINAVPMVEPLASYVKIYAIRQALWYQGFPIPRFGGTFFEAPPFGLFMFSVFVILIIAGAKGVRSKWINAGIFFSLLGVIASLADQVILGMLVLFPVLVVAYMKSRLKWNKIWILFFVVPVLTTLIAGMSLFALYRLTEKAQENIHTTDFIGTSGGERYFHIKYGLSLLGNNPMLAAFGVGPGRYGDYAAQTGLFANTVTPQVFPLELLVEYGLVGSLLIILWLVEISRKAVYNFGLLGLSAFIGLLLANVVQSNWKWESWFMALSFLYSGACWTRPLQQRSDLPVELSVATSKV